MSALVICAVALAAGAVLPLAVRPILQRFNMVDMPNERSSHTTPTYRGMGLATACAALLAMLVALLAGWMVNAPIAWTLLLSIAAACTLGWCEDISGVGIKARAGVQLLIGAVACVILATIIEPEWAVPTWILVASCTIFVAGYINVVNFMDGINGISGSHGLLVGLAYAYTGYLVDLPWLSLTGAAIAGAYAAFIPWNIRPGKNVFLGDAGSYTLGAALGLLAVAGFFAGVNPVIMLAPLLVYLTDSGLTLARRVLAGEQWYKPHRTHVYQRLTDVGFSHLGSTSLVAGATVLCWVLGMNAGDALDTGQYLLAAVLLVLIVAVLALYWLSPALLTQKSDEGQQGAEELKTESAKHNLAHSVEKTQMPADSAHEDFNPASGVASDDIKGSNAEKSAEKSVFDTRSVSATHSSETTAKEG
ncbi:MAG: glycosyltransferase family 4 protein [Rothia sp. (in: high G+C Gram-positive bacteria)]|uniref:MraY family glycosyltransferase n=1 Tax=Rothia sp. (in: high G+C Gram-positive bacteria) TaxID=1885016 RepID=UPI0026DEDBDB|nr:glycosyltransferase family 4 protein [Rothia sp. (in: high G+C Gram-positive bacteria)]MDO5750771.1 glycosyltransferase family 4 protein [Rothia sp. (in: high G+C Gram-positive bacteria)]